jgi:hypothetical protein
MMSASQTPSVAHAAPSDGNLDAKAGGAQSKRLPPAVGARLGKVTTSASLLRKGKKARPAEGRERRGRGNGSATGAGLT